jgi:hypothetical protein
MATRKYGKVPSGHPFGSKSGVNLPWQNAPFSVHFAPVLMQNSSLYVRFLRIGSERPLSDLCAENPTILRFRQCSCARQKKTISLMGATGSE